MVDHYLSGDCAAVRTGRVGHTVWHHFVFTLSYEKAGYREDARQPPTCTHQQRGRNVRVLYIYNTVVCGIEKLRNGKLGQHHPELKSNLHNTNRTLKVIYVIHDYSE